MFYTVKLKAGETAYNFGVEAVSYTDADKMAHEIGSIICTGSSFEVDRINKVQVTEFIEDDTKISKDIKIFKGKFASREELPNGKVKTKRFTAFVEGEDLADAVANLKIFLKSFVVETVAIGMEETELTEIYTPDDLRTMRSATAA